MKRIISIIVITTVTSLLMMSCEDFIGLTPESEIASNEVYKTDQDFNDAVIGVYSTLQSQYQSFWQFELPSDDVTHQWPTEDTRLRMDIYTWQSNENLFQNSWENYYEIIFRANTILSRIEERDVESKELYIAEAKFLRAFAYFDLVRLFGDVPMITRVMTPDEVLSKGRESVETIYNKVIIKDLLEAEKLPESYSGSNVGRATKGAAKALLGRVYLTIKDFENAEEKLQEVTSMNYALLNDYNDLWDYTDEHHSEYIFDIEYEEGIQEGSNFTNSFSPQDEELKRVYGISGGSGNSYTPPDSLFAIFDSTDTRKEITAATGFTDEEGNFVSISGDVGAKTFTKKYMTPTQRSGDSPANWKVIRYADVLLMYAEALNENGKTNEALNYLNQIRDRAGLEGYQDLTQAEAREKIYLERRLELSFEGHRWFDLVRTDRAKDVLEPLGMQPYMTLFPIPRDEVEVINDPDIFPQNPGY